jgi:hypothetical protein
MIRINKDGYSDWLGVWKHLRSIVWNLFFGFPVFMLREILLTYCDVHQIGIPDTAVVGMFLQVSKIRVVMIR